MKWVFRQTEEPKLYVLAPQAVEKGACAFFDKRLHGGRGSISCEIVPPSAMRRVIFEAHVPENDGF